jgi:hypothetical protein
MSTASSGRGLGRPALTLEPDLDGVKPSNAIPRVYQSESRNAFIAEYERFKDVRVNLGAMFPVSPLSALTLEGWVSFRIGVVEDRLSELQDTLACREKRIRDRRRAFANGPIPLYDVQVGKYPQPALKFPSSIVERKPVMNTFKMDDAYFPNWSEIAYLWDPEGRDPEPTAESDSCNGSYAGDEIFSPLTKPANTFTAISSQRNTPEPKGEIETLGGVAEIDNYEDMENELMELELAGVATSESQDLNSLLKHMALDDDGISGFPFPSIIGYAFESGSDYSDRPDDYSIYLPSPTSQDDETDEGDETDETGEDGESEETDRTDEDGEYENYGAYLHSYTGAGDDAEEAEKDGLDDGISEFYLDLYPGIRYD